MGYSKQFHNRLWENCQEICMVPIMLLLVYRFLFGVWDLRKYYVPETIGSHWECLRFYNLRNLPVDAEQEHKRRERYKDLPKIQPTWVDLAFWLYAYTGLPYYYYDTFYRIFYTHGGNVFDVTLCDWIFISHHLVSSFFWKFYGSMYYYPWYFMAPAAYHSVMLTHPDFYWNHLIYGVMLFFFFAGNFLEPLWTTRVHKYVAVSVVTLAPFLFMMSGFGCA